MIKTSTVEALHAVSDHLGHVAQVTQADFDRFSSEHADRPDWIETKQRLAGRTIGDATGFKAIVDELSGRNAPEGTESIEIAVDRAAEMISTILDWQKHYPSLHGMNAIEQQIGDYPPRPARMDLQNALDSLQARQTQAQAPQERYKPAPRVPGSPAR